MRITLLYKDFDYVVFLDNNLTILRDPISLGDLNLTDAEAVCGSQRGGFWVYDSNDSRLKYFDSQLQVSSQSNSIMLNESPDSILQLTEFTDYVLIAFAKNGIFVFDKFAGYVAALPINNAKSLFVTGNIIYIVNDENLVSYNIINRSVKNIDLPEAGFSQAVFTGSTLYLVINNFLKIYSVVEN